MRLERIRLQNFRQYTRENRLSFARDPKRNVTVIHGANGAGKTSLFTALNWCLYGTKAFANEAALVSKAALAVVGDGSRVETSVEVTFTHQGERFVALRHLVAKRGADGSAILAGSSVLTIMRVRAEGDARPVPEPEYLISAILPENVRTYFLFDGERIDEFSKPGSPAVEDAIRRVLKLNVLVKSQQHLTNIAADYRETLGKLATGEYQKLVHEDIELRAERDELAQRRTSLDQEIASARTRIAKIDETLKELEATRALQEQREKLRAELAQNEGDRDSVLLAMRELIAGGYLLLSDHVVGKAADFLDQKRARGEIPGSVRRQFVEDLIIRLNCVCGRPFEADGPEHQELLALLERTLPGSIEDNVLETAAVLRSFAERAQRLRADIRHLAERREALVDAVESLAGEIEEVGTKIGDVAAEPGALERQRKEYELDVEGYAVEKGSIGRRIQELDRAIVDLKFQMEHAVKQEARHQSVSIRMRVAQDAADAIASVYDEFANQLRIRVEVQTRELFQQLVWKGTQFSSVSLGPDYDLRVTDRWGLPARPDLSAGERQVLSLAFIGAMGRVSEEEAPLVMDTPFGRLSSVHRNSVTTHLPSLTHQLVLFVTDEELRDQARQNIERHIGAEYQLEFDENEGSTRIVEIPR
jgi:DNA sulfur modification protein DndD